MAAVLTVALTAPACEGSHLSSGSRAANSGSGGRAGDTSDASTGMGGLILLDWDAGQFGGQTDAPCDASVACDPGDTPIDSDTDCLAAPNVCYVKEQCGQFLSCRRNHGGPGVNRDSGTAAFSPSTYFPLCNPGDEQVASAIKRYSSPGVALPADCPPNRECYSQVGIDGAILCMMPEGVHCYQPSCHAGDAKAANVVDPSALAGYYAVVRCDKSILCKSISNAGESAPTCFGTYSDGTGEMPEASQDGGDATPSCCGNGRIDPGEYCDLGLLNGTWIGSYMFRCSRSCQFDGPI